MVYLIVYSIGMMIFGYMLGKAFELCYRSYKEAHRYGRIKG